jgi:hypothetical protein
MGSVIDDIIRFLLKIAGDGNPLLTVIVICFLVVFAVIKLFDRSGPTPNLHPAQPTAGFTEILPAMSRQEIQQAIENCRLIHSVFAKGDSRKAIETLLNLQFLTSGMRSEVELLSNQFETEMKRLNLGLGNDQQEVNRINKALLGLVSDIEQQLERTAIVIQDSKRPDV